ncbi:MAG TPA: molybdopterin-dependent oxidoreductase [bacterium]|nr:molybdopterin-dependent oxidoreductase [bacterium]
MSRIYYGVCNFCDSSCGLAIEYEGDRVLSVKGDKENAFSRGHICPKGMALKDLYHDPDRLRRPMRRTAAGWEEVSWNDALDEAGQRIAAVQKKYGRHALALYYGNPTAGDYALLLCLLPFIKALRTKNIYSATSLDSLTRMLTSLWLYGSQAVMPVPDLERTRLLIIIGANPVVSHGSVMTAPDTKRRLQEIRERGGKIIVIDPRRTETAAIADSHHFIRPGADALFLLAFIHTLFEEGLADPGALKGRIEGMDELQKIAREFPPARVAPAVGISAETIASLAREFAAEPRAVMYGRMGVSTQEFGSLATWLADAVNIVAGKLDREGGYMFNTPAVDLAGLAKVLKQPGFFNRWQSRVSGLPEFNGEFPVAALAEEMETPGPGQIKALITLAGNPSLSAPNARRLDAAFKNLEFMLAIDFYLNETTRHAHIILPPVSPLETDNYHILFYALAVRNVAHYTPALFKKPAGARHNWEIPYQLMRRVDKHRGGADRVIGAVKWPLLTWLKPRRQLGLLLRLGPHKLSIAKLLKHPHGLDLGPLEPRFDKVIATRDRVLHLVPPALVPDLGRLEARLDRAPDQLLLISRRTMRSMNSWMHNLPRLVEGKNRCTLQMNPADAERLGLEQGAPVNVSTRLGKIEVPLEVTEDMMPGVVCMPFGWGHGREGSRLSVAAQHPGVSMNDITDDALFDKVSGISVLDGIPVKVTPVA